MSEENKQQTALILRIIAVFILTVMVLVAAFVGPKYRGSDPSISIQNKNQFENNLNTHNTNPIHNAKYDITSIPLDQNQLSNYKHWMNKYGTSKCHSHDAIYDFKTNCLSQECYTNNNNNPTFNNQLILEGKIWSKKFIQQIHNINTSLFNYITNNNISLYPTRMDLNRFRGKNNKNKIIKQKDTNIFWIHMVLEYFCCYTSEQYNTIIKAMEKFQFKTFDIVFDKYLCVENDNINIVLFADAESQQYLSRLTDRIEEYLRDDYNINIHSHRRDSQPFHVTLLVMNVNTENQEYAMDIIKWLNDNYKWQDIKIQIHDHKSVICMNDNSDYDIKYTCF